MDRLSVVALKVEGIARWWHGFPVACPDALPCAESRFTHAAAAGTVALYLALIARRQGK
jgi:hypothetical protein